MEVDPPPDVKKFCSKDVTVDLLDTNTTQVESPPNSTPSSGNLQITPSITVHFTEEELLVVQKFISLSKSGRIQVVPAVGDDRTSQGLPINEKSANSIVPIASSTLAISERMAQKSPESRLHFQPSLEGIRGGVPTGDYSPHQGEPHTKNPAENDSGIACEVNSGEYGGSPATFEARGQRQKVHNDELSLNIKKSRDQIGDYSGKINFEQIEDNSQKVQYEVTKKNDEVNNGDIQEVSSEVPLHTVSLDKGAAEQAIDPNENKQSHINSHDQEVATDDHKTKSLEAGNAPSGSLGINNAYLPLRHQLMNWWSTKYKNEGHKLILHSTPIFICWNLWKNRCARKYGGKTSNLAKVKFSVFKDTSNLLTTVFPYIQWPASWRELVLLIDKCSHETKVTTVYWNKPPAHWVKLNTDGSALTNPGRIGAGGILRNHLGDLIFAFATPLGDGTNNQAEMEAAIFGLTWCLQLGYSNIILEVDSALLINWITTNTQPPWSISQHLDRLRNTINQVQNFKCNHTFREANCIADALSKHSHKCSSPQLYFDKRSLSKEATTYLELDKWEMANFRRRKLKRIKKPP